jgi:hypothetical protein
MTRRSLAFWSVNLTANVKPGVRFRCRTERRASPTVFVHAYGGASIGETLFLRVINLAKALIEQNPLGGLAATPTPRRS